MLDLCVFYVSYIYFSVLISEERGERKVWPNHL